MKRVLLILSLLASSGLYSQSRIELNIQQASALIINTGSTSTSIQAGSSVQLGSDIAVTGGTGGFQYSWEPGESISDPYSLITVANPSASTVYSLSVVDEQGCSIKMEYSVNVETSDGISTVDNMGTIFAYVSNQHCSNVAITIESPAVESVLLRLCDLLGKEIYKNTLDLPLGKYVESVPKALLPGAYVMQLISSSERYSQFFVVF